MAGPSHFPVLLGEGPVYTDGAAGDVGTGIAVTTGGFWQRTPSDDVAVMAEVPWPLRPSSGAGEFLGLALAAQCSTSTSGWKGEIVTDSQAVFSRISRKAFSPLRDFMWAGCFRGWHRSGFWKALSPTKIRSHMSIGQARQLGVVDSWFGNASARRAASPPGCLER